MADQPHSSPSKRTRVPRSGTFWIWEIASPHARALCRIEEAFWNGEEWWVRLAKMTVEAPIGDPNPQDVAGVYPNDLERFWEAVVPVNGTVEDLTEWRDDA